MIERVQGEANKGLGTKQAYDQLATVIIISEAFEGPAMKNECQQVWTCERGPQWP